MEGIKYVNLIEIGPVVIEIRGAENGELAVPVNNTLVSHTAFLATDTRPCVLIILRFTLGGLCLIIVSQVSQFCDVVCHHLCMELIVY